jgi:hypothetical protein
MVFFVLFLAVAVVGGFDWDSPLLSGKFDWETYERNVAMRRIGTAQLMSENPFDFKIDWPTYVWSNTTIDFLKANITRLDNIPAEIYWTDYTSCIHETCFKGEPIYAYAGTIMRIKISQNKGRGEEDYEL